MPRLPPERCSRGRTHGLPSWTSTITTETEHRRFSIPIRVCCSVHADPNLDYPFFWGAPIETGEGSGTGHNHNWPLPHGATEEQFLAALDQALKAIVLFAPAYLVLSAGFDFMQDDPVPLVGGFQIGQAGLLAASRRIATLKLPTVIIQEGGYNVEKLGGYVASFLQEFQR